MPARTICFVTLDECLKRVLNLNPKKKNMKSIFVSCIISVFFFIPGLYAQIPSQDSVRFQYDKIYASCLDGDVQSALLLLAIDR